MLRTGRGPLVAAGLAGAVWAAAVGTPPAAAQQEPAPADDGRERLYERADSLRRSWDRPPPRPSPGLPEALGTFMAVLGAPLQAVGEGVGFVAGAALPAWRTVDRTLAAAGLEPDLETLGPRSGPGAVLRLEWPGPVFVEAGRSLHGTQRWAGGIRASAPDGRDLRVAVTHVDHDEPHFWGVGPGTAPDRVADYGWRRLRASAAGRLPLSDAVEVGVEAGWERNRVRRGGDGSVADLHDRYGDAELFGLGEDPTLATLGASVTWDRTRWSFLQKRGFAATLGSSLFLGTSGTTTDFLRVEADAHTYLPLTRRHALAVRTLVEVNRGLDGGEIPFTHLASLGSSRGGRGFAADRFRDRDLAAVMGEYRYEIWRDQALGVGAEGVVLGDVGAVEENLLEIDGADLRPSWGIGVRVVKDAALQAFGYLAFSEEETRVNLKFSWPF